MSMVENIKVYVFNVYVLKETIAKFIAKQYLQG